MMAEAEAPSGGLRFRHSMPVQGRRAPGGGAGGSAPGMPTDLPERPTRMQSFDAFWPYYLREHARPATRAVHVAGTWSGAVLLAWGLLLGPWWLALLAPVVGYGCAWGSHAFLERNRPATFTHPLWSLRGDLHMAWLAATGGLAAELRRHGL